MQKEASTRQPGKRNTGKGVFAMYEKILVPLDGSAHAERAIRHAEEIARGTRSEILLLQAVSFPIPVVPEAVLLPDSKWLAEARKDALRYLDGIAAPLREAGMRVRTMVDERPPADAILHVASREEVDLIVMSTHGRGGLTRLLMGSVAESVFRATSRTVMLVKPEPPAVTAQKDEDWFLHVP
jgi:nucleotide-binding universal stress UspA family protein